MACFEFPGGLPSSRRWAYAFPMAPYSKTRQFSYAEGLALLRGQVDGLRKVVRALYKATWEVNPPAKRLLEHHLGLKAFDPNATVLERVGEQWMVTQLTD